MKPGGLDDDDEDERHDEDRKRRDDSEKPQSSTAKSFLSGVLPAPKHSATLGVLPTSGSGRRSIIDTQVSASDSEGYRTDNDGVLDQSTGSYGKHDNSASYQQYDNYGNYQNAGYGYHTGFDQNVGVSGPLGPSQASVADTSTDGNYDGYASYVDYGQYGNDGVTDGSVAAVPEEPSGFRATTGKKKRNEIPTEIVEVKQDELMKNRPREDQAKLTGIAFGPTYQVITFLASSPSVLCHLSLSLYMCVCVYIFFRLNLIRLMILHLSICFLLACYNVWAGSYTTSILGTSMFLVQCVFLRIQLAITRTFFVYQCFCICPLASYYNVTMLGLYLILHPCLVRVGS